jgi:hypothetical protein
MNLAVCISGHPRFFKKSFAYIEDNLLKNFKNLDVYLHCWGNELSEEDRNCILRLYNPKEYLFEDEKFHILNYPFLQSKSKPNHVFSMFFSIMKANELKKKYEKENNFKYDWTFRLRFDFALNKFFDESILKSLNNKLIYVNNFEENPNPHCADCFGFSGSESMDIYSNTYNNILSYGETGTTLAGESMLYRQFMEHNLQLARFDVQHPFNPDFTTCWCRHSLIRA